MIDLTQIRSDLGDIASTGRTMEIFENAEAGDLFQRLAGIVLTLAEEIERLQTPGDLMAGCEPLPPLADLAGDLLRNIARVPNEVPAFPSRWSFEPDERRVG